MFKTFMISRKKFVYSENLFSNLCLQFFKINSFVNFFLKSIKKCPEYLVLLSIILFFLHALNIFDRENFLL